MRIYGIDFTSAPTRRKPMIVAECVLDGAVLRLQRFHNLESLTGFENRLRSPGPWVAGLDFPFGQPKELIKNLGWPASWSSYVADVAEMTKDDFVACLTDYCAGRPAGEKFHFRPCDRFAGAQSPMMVYGVPVAKMFFAGAPRLLHSGVSVPPVHPTQENAIALEAYPALVARAVIGRRKYKGATQEGTRARRTLIERLQAGATEERYGIRTVFTAELASVMVNNANADALDSLFCAVQAAWAQRQPNRNYGIPEDCDAREGWIVDPALAGELTASG